MLLGVFFMFLLLAFYKSVETSGRFVLDGPRRYDCSIDVTWGGGGKRCKCPPVFSLPNSSFFATELKGGN
jgi:hypothetical protein